MCVSPFLCTRKTFIYLSVIRFYLPFIICYYPDCKSERDLGFHFNAICTFVSEHQLQLVTCSTGLEANKHAVTHNKVMFVRNNDSDFIRICCAVWFVLYLLSPLFSYDTEHNWIFIWTTQQGDKFVCVILISIHVSPSFFSFNIKMHYNIKSRLQGYMIND